MCPTTYASISAGGVLTTRSVTSNQTVTVTASYTSGGVHEDAYRSSTRLTVLASIAVSGPSSVNEGGTGTYTATATWDNGTTTSITPTWSVCTSYAYNRQRRRPDDAMVTSNQPVTVTASYTAAA